MFSQESPETDGSSEESDDEYCYSIHNVVSNVTTALPEITLKLDNINTSLLVDTGSTVNILDEQTHKQLGQLKLKKGLEPNLYRYGNSSPLHVLGQCEIVVETKSQLQCHKFYVTEGDHGSLIGYPTAKALNLVKIIHKVNDPATKYPYSSNEWARLRAFL